MAGLVKDINAVSNEYVKPRGLRQLIKEVEA